MIRSFSWRDVGLVKALGEQGVCLDSETGLLRGNHSLQNALFAYLIPGTGAPTIVWRAAATDGGRSAFGQLAHKIGEEQARIMCIAPPCDEAPEAWTSILEKLAVEAGDRGALNLLAEVNEEGCEFEALRTAGFAVYARQSLWKLTEGQPLQTNAHAVPLRPTTELDLIGISTLCSNIIPRLVQQVEPVNQRIVRGYVLEHRGEIIAFLDVRRGPLGVWIEPYLHPEAYKLSEAVLHTSLHLIADGNDRPIYLCIHRYQDWLQEIVARAGFKALGSQAVMVKRLTARVKEPLRKALPVIETTHVPTPITQAQMIRPEQKN